MSAHGDADVAGVPVSQSRSRRVLDLAQKARGRTPLKYEFTVIPFFCGELPSGLERLSFVWERGSKVFATEAEPVNPHTRACFWQQHLRQTATVYQDGTAFASKEYAFKVQAVRKRGPGGAGGEDRRTVGRVRVDFAAFCSAEADPLPREVFLQLKPAGKLKVSIRAGWLKGAAPDEDELTEASFLTRASTEGGGSLAGVGGGSGSAAGGRGGGSGGGLGDDDEQDLSGFEGHAAGRGVHSRSGSIVGSLIGEDGGRGPPAVQARGSVARLGMPQHASAAGSGQSQQLTPMQAHNPKAAALAGGLDGRGGGAALGSPLIAAVGAHGWPRPRLPGEIPQFAVPMSAEEQRQELERQKQRVMEAAEQHIEAMRRNMHEAMRAEVAIAMGKRSSLASALCCCWPHRQSHGTSEMVPLEKTPAPVPDAAVSEPPTSADL